MLYLKPLKVLAFCATLLVLPKLQDSGPRKGGDGFRRLFPEYKPFCVPNSCGALGQMPLELN